MQLRSYCIANDETFHHSNTMGFSCFCFFMTCARARNPRYLTHEKCVQWLAPHLFKCILGVLPLPPPPFPHPWPQHQLSKKEESKEPKQSKFFAVFHCKESGILITACVLVCVCVFICLFVRAGVCLYMFAQVGISNVCE